MSAQKTDVLYAERLGISGTVTVGDIIKLNNTTFISIDFGTKPINEKLFNIVDVNCTSTSVIDLSQYFISQIEENFGEYLDLFTECLEGSFNVIAVSQNNVSRGIFNLKYNIL